MRNYKITGGEIKTALKIPVCLSKHTQIQCQGQPLQYPTIQYRKNSLACIYVGTHTFKGTNTCTHTQLDE